jgi:hypothetical protein
VIGGSGKDIGGSDEPGDRKTSTRRIAGHFRILLLW